MTITSQNTLSMIKHAHVRRTLSPACSQLCKTGPRERAPLSQFLLVMALAMLPAGSAFAVTPPATRQPRPVQRTVIVQPSANARFQQTVRQQHVRDQLQKAQVEQQNHQAVSDNSRRPHDSNPQLQQQIDQSSAAQQRINQARQQDMINRYKASPPPTGRVVRPQKSNPKPAGGG